MKKLLLHILLFAPLTVLFAQNSFEFEEIEDPTVSSIVDMLYAGGKYYALATHMETEQPVRVSGDLLVFDENGNLLNQYALGGEGYEYYQILSVRGDTLKLIGSVITTECSSSLLLSEYIISTATLNHQSELPLCDSLRIIQRAKAIKGLDGKLFFEVNYGYPFSFSYYDKAYIATINDQQALTYVVENLVGSQHLSIDFAEKGYLIKTTDHMKFYDRQFNYRKDRNNSLDDYDDDHNNYSAPFGHKYILDQVKKKAGSPIGQAIRLLDSNFYVKKLAVISPDEDIFRPVSLPPYGGVEILNENTIWTTSNYGYYTGATSSFYTISRLDQDLNIVCTHFGGFDKLYRIYGITAFENDGAAVFGWYAPFGYHDFDEEIDIYAVKVSENCELSTSIGGVQQNNLSITAYPNPSINSITFDVQGFDPATLSVEIYDVDGKTLFSQKDLSYEIKVSDLVAGQYFYRILQKDILLGAGSWVKQ